MVKRSIVFQAESIDEADQCITDNQEKENEQFWKTVNVNFNNFYLILLLKE